MVKTISFFLFLFLLSASAASGQLTISFAMCKPSDSTDTFHIISSRLSIKNERSCDRHIKVLLSINKKDSFYFSPEYYRDEQGVFYSLLPPVNGKKMMLTDKIPAGSWSFTGEKDTIIGYPCLHAKTIYQGQHISAWYAPSLPHGFGPQICGGLPGTILLLELPFHSYKAVKLEQEAEDILLPEAEITDRATYNEMIRKLKALKK